MTNTLIFFGFNGLNRASAAFIVSPEVITSSTNKIDFPLKEDLSFNIIIAEI